MPTFTLSRRKAIVLALCVLGGILLLSRILSAGSAGEQAAPITFPPPTDAAEAAPKAVVVDVTGAVRRPGVYRLKPGARVADAIAKAGGVTRKAEPGLVNRPAPLADGQQVVVPLRGAVGTGAAGGEGPPAPVSLSAASVEELETLPGVGPVTAQKIVDYRTEHGPFTSVEELDAIPGIGPKRIESLEGLVIP